MTENEEFIYESIYSQVRMGFSSIPEIKENIIEEIEDNEFEEEISEKWAIATIEKEHEKLISESKKWKTPTDTEKLIEAFDELCKDNIIALHNAGYETSDGEYEVCEIEKKLNQNQINSDGYCFYHEQDLSRAIKRKNPELYIAFQKINNSNDEITLAIGRRIAKKLTEKGFDIIWEEDIKSKILIQNFKWQYLYKNTRDLNDYDDVIELILKEQFKNSKNSSDFCLKTVEIYNINPDLIDIIDVIKNIKYYDEDTPSFIILEFKKNIKNILYLQAIINDDFSYSIELRIGDENDFKHYSFNTKEKNIIIDYFKKVYEKKEIDYSNWNNVTEEFN